jgi:hypothetical protein
VIPFARDGRIRQREERRFCGAMSGPNEVIEHTQAQEMWVISVTKYRNIWRTQHRGNCVGGGTNSGGGVHGSRRAKLQNQGSRASTCGRSFMRNTSRIEIFGERSMSRKVGHAGAIRWRRLGPGYQQLFSQLGLGELNGDVSIWSAANQTEHA